MWRRPQVLRLRASPFAQDDRLNNKVLRLGLRPSLRMTTPIFGHFDCGLRPFAQDASNRSLAGVASVIPRSLRERGAPGLVLGSNGGYG